jgi:hypothetical protein
VVARAVTGRTANLPRRLLRLTTTTCSVVALTIAVVAATMAL